MYRPGASHWSHSSVHNIPLLVSKPGADRADLLISPQLSRPRGPRATGGDPQATAVAGGVQDTQSASAHGKPHMRQLLSALVSGGSIRRLNARREMLRLSSVSAMTFCFISSGNSATRA